MSCGRRRLNPHTNRQPRLHSLGGTAQSSRRRQDSIKAMKGMASPTGIGNEQGSCRQRLGRCRSVNMGGGRGN
eukprot:366524-Chlamydomonas_euryale.AAC.11